MTKRRYRVTVHAGFNEDGIWTIDAQLRYARGVVPPRRSAIRGIARAALYNAVGKERLRGMHLYGAKRMSVHFDTGEEVVDFSPDDPFPTLTPPRRPSP